VLSQGFQCFYFTWKRAKGGRDIKEFGGSLTFSAVEDADILIDE
jgi:hypothetical protein